MLNVKNLQAQVCRLKLKEDKKMEVVTMIKYYVLNESSDIWSDGYLTREEAEKELDENFDAYGFNGKIIEVEER